VIAHISREGENYENLLKHYPEGSKPDEYSVINYDVGLLLGKALIELEKENLLQGDFLEISAEKWTQVIRNISFQGASGFIAFNENGDRPTDYVIKNFLPEQLDWRDVGIWNHLADSIELTENIIWPDNTTKVPDLDIRKPFGYWSCHEKEHRVDKTGKTIVIETPDGSDANNIDSEYYCDGFVDCQNISDESFSCTTDYVALYIAFGILTGILIFIAILCIPFVLIFGCFRRRRRITAASPIFLLIITISVIVGYCSTFAWYGKPNAVACGFQPWLLGLSVVSIVAALSSKTFRVWRIFNSPFKKVVITNLELVVLWILIMIPAVIILALWTLISTPTATMVEAEDKDHYSCYTGGFSGYPGGYVFFGVFVGYISIVVSFALFLSIKTRKVPSLFNESRLIAISIYNITLLGVVVVPTVLVLNYFEPFIGWIIRTLAILYGCTATLWVQFIPKIVGFVVTDKCKDTNLLKVAWTSSVNQQTAGNTLNST